MSFRKIVLLGAATAAIAAATVAFAAPGDVRFMMYEPTSDRTGYFFTINRHNNAHTDGALINLWEENGHASQVWRWGTGTQSQTLRSKTNPAFCLNLHNNAHVNGATINLWTCSSHNSMKWIVSGNTLRPASAPSFCVNLHNNNRTDGALINLWQCNGHESQNFQAVTE